MPQNPYRFLKQIVKVLSTKKLMSRHMLGKLQNFKNKEKSLQSKEKNNTLLIRENHSNNSGFLIRNHGGRRKWHNSFQVLKDVN